MKYAVNLYFDKDTEEKLSSLANSIADETKSDKISGYNIRPHLTLACFNDVDEPKCIKLLKTFAESRKAMPVKIGSVGMFTDSNTVFAVPTMTAEIIRLQHELHDVMSEFDKTGWDRYCPDNWSPHCTLAYTIEEGNEVFLKASEVLLRKFHPMTGKYAGLGLVNITPQAKDIFEIELPR